MKKIALTILVIALATMSSKAQEAITIVGGDCSNSSGSISLSCGEVAVQHSVAKAITVVNITSYYTEGVQQSFSTGHNDITSPLPIKITVGPNPTHDLVEIIIAEELPGLQYTLYSIKGETIKSSLINGERTTIDLASMPAGTYLLRVESNNKNEKNTYKIIKAN